MTLIAKPVIDKQFWILQDGNQKVGNVEACAGGYQIKIRNQVAQFKTIRMLAQQVNVKFESPPKFTKNKFAITNVYDYPVNGRAYNPMWDVQMKLPVYTKTTKSKSWFAAGWYCVKRGKLWSTTQCPKLIVLQRYSYVGPFHSKEQADEHTPS